MKTIFQKKQKHSSGYLTTLAQFSGEKILFKHFVSKAFPLASFLGGRLNKI
jgi:hypothetical protein